MTAIYQNACARIKIARLLESDHRKQARKARLRTLLDDAICCLFLVGLLGSILAFAWGL